MDQPAASRNAGQQRDLSVNWEGLGVVHKAHGDLACALQSFTSSNNIRDQPAPSDPGNALWQRNLAGALDAYTQSQTITARLAASDPGNAGCQRDLIVSHRKLAALLERIPDRAG